MSSFPGSLSHLPMGKLLFPFSACAGSTENLSINFWNSKLLTLFIYFIKSEPFLDCHRKTVLFLSSILQKPENWGRNWNMAKILQGPAGLQGIENLKHCKMLDPLGQAWQNGNARFGCLDAWPYNCKQTQSLRFPIENLKCNKMLDPLGQAWQIGSALAA